MAACTLPWTLETSAAFLSVLLPRRRLRVPLMMLLHSSALYSVLLTRSHASAWLQITDEMVPTDRLALQVLAQEMRDWPRLRVSGG